MANKQTKRVAQAIKKMGGKCMKSELFNATGFSKKRLNEVLSTMEEAGTVTVEQGESNGRGRPPVVVKLT